MSNCIVKYKISKTEVELLTDLISYYYNRLKYVKDKKVILAKINELQSQLDELVDNSIEKWTNVLCWS